MKIRVLCQAAVLLLACPAFAGQAPNSPVPVIVQMSYYAQPGQEDAVLRLRLKAADVLSKRGVGRGRVWRTTDSARATKDPIGPTVIWQGEFVDASALAKYEEVADKDPDFLAIRKQMATVTVRG